MFPQFVSIVLAAEGNNREKAEKRKGVFMLLDTLAYGLIPLVTVWFSRGYGWFSTNFSVIANEFEKQRGFFLWGLLVGIYFLLVVRKMAVTLQAPGGLFFWLGVDLALLFLSIQTPYQPEAFPQKAELHIWFSFLAAVLLGVLVLWITGSMYRREPLVYRGQWRCLWVIFGLCGLLLLGVGMVSSALELFFTLSMVFFCQHMQKKLEETKKNGLHPSQKEIE